MNVVLEREQKTENEESIFFFFLKKEGEAQNLKHLAGVEKMTSRKVVEN